ncbi:MAG: DUF1116 domain-containing protein [Hyphomicrobiales bacterium]|nr:DUF1116 domain-containing protein [Hyphomicrobiales bacterium]MDE2285257.1 DUF1116 domain-containing protein [Hyphomicrobiales bacterium]
MAPHIVERTPSVINVGVADFTRSVVAAGADALQIDWHPPGKGDPNTAWNLARLTDDSSDSTSLGAHVDRANAEAVQRMIDARPMLIDVALHARDVWPEMERTLLHAGAPIAWEKMCGPMQGAMIGATLYEGWAATPEAARRMLAGGEVAFLPCHDSNAVGPMSGIISPSMPVFVARNAVHENYAYTNMNEGIGKVLRFGANSQNVIDHLRWIERVLAPELKRVITSVAEGIDLKAIQSQALLMGDEVHSRNSAATALFYAAIVPPLLAGDFDYDRASQALRFIGSNSQFFLNLSMLSSKTTMDAAHGVENSSIVTAISRNGVTTAIRVSGLDGAWFQDFSDLPVGLFFPGFTQDDANPDLGDSAIAETAGFGGMSLAASPALVQLVGGAVNEAVGYSREMYNITRTKNPAMSLPLLDFAGAPTGIDIRKVVDTGIRPVVTTGIAHKEPGIGQIGAGIVRPPMACFTEALAALLEAVESTARRDHGKLFTL